MTRILSSGFELRSVGTGVEVSNTVSTPTISTTTFRSGAAALRISSLSSGATKGILFQYVFTAGTGPYFPRTYFMVATLPSAANTIIVINNNLAFTTPLVWLTIDNTGVLQLNDEDGAIGSPSGVLSTGVWYRIELRFDITGAAGSHVVEALLDGSVFSTASNRSISANAAVFGLGGNGLVEAQTTGDWFFDDVAINNSSGSFQTSFPGAGGIILLRPNAAGDADEWSVTNTFEDIDEITPNDATDFISSLTSGQIHDVNVDDTPAAIGSGDTINVVAVGVRFNESVGTDPDPIFVVRVKESSGGTVQESGSITANQTGWRTNETNGTTINYTLVTYDLPGASTTPWTKAVLDTAQIGVRLTNSPVGLAQVSALWLLVDFTPAVAGSSIVPILMAEYRRRRN